MCSSLSLTGCSGKKAQIKYATDYALEVYKTEDLSDGWEVWKEKRSGSEYLSLTNQKDRSEKTEREQLMFWVYDSADIAKVQYKELYDRSNSISKEGDNWYVGHEPDVCDATITWVVCREDNVIITGELLCVGEWGGVNVVRSENATDHKDTYKKELEEYVVKNYRSLKKFVMKDLLGY